MTLSATLSSGRGELSYRLEIERWAEQWVTHRSMASATRLEGLRVRGAKLKCIANPVTNDLDVSGMACSIVDISSRATRVFGTFPTRRTWLTAPMSVSDTVMNVRSTSGFATSGTLWVDSEAITYTGVTSGTFTGCTRGALSSLAQAHYVAAFGATRYPEVTAAPVSMAGCRAKLYVYGQNDDPQGDGTLLWQGIITRHPTMQGAEWKLSMDPITSVLTRTVSADLSEPASPRGIYYHATSPFRMSFIRADTLDVMEIIFPITTSDRGFFESNADFCDYLNAKLEAGIIARSWDAEEIRLSASADGDASWSLQVSSNGTVVEVLRNPGPIDPQFAPQPVNGSGDSVPGTATWAADIVYTYQATTDSAPGAGSCPRGYYSDMLGAAGGFVPAELGEAFPPRRLHLSNPIAVSALVDTVSIEWQSFAGYPERVCAVEISASDASDNWVETTQGFTGGPFPTPVSSAFTSQSLPNIRFGRTFAASGSVWSALSAIITAAPVGLNAGGIPDLRASDFDSASWAELDELWQPRIVRARSFRSFSDMSLMDMVKNDLTLAGYFIGLSTSGGISIARIRNVVSTTAADVVIDSVLVQPGGVPTWEPTAYGLINQVVVRRGYDGLSDEYTLGAVMPRDVASFGRNPRPRGLAIEPKSVPASGVAESLPEALEVVSRLFSVFAQPYARIALTVPLSKYTGSLVGNVATITTPLLPDPYTGTRGLEDQVAMITGREIDLDRGAITLFLVATLNNAAGYAPQSLLTAESNVSGDTWDVTLSADYFPAGTDAADWFLAGDLVLAREWDDASPTTLSGTVVSATGLVVRVTFTSSAAGLTSGDWYLSYRNADGALQASQYEYCFLADSVAIVDKNGSLEPAYSFG